MRLPQIKGSAPREYTTKYTKFKGVDFSSDPALIASERSPWAPNLISDTGGNPEKRPGWRKLLSVDQPINGLYYGVIDNQTTFLVHGGTKLYTWNEDGTTAIIRENINNGKSVAFVLKNSIWILTGSEYLVYGMFDNPDYTEGGTAPKQTLQIKDVTEIAYVPTTIIARAPSGGGTVYESVNLLQPKRINKFLTTSEKTYHLDSTSIQSVEKVTLNGSVKTVTTDYTVNLTNGTITFTASTMPTPPVAGQDNLEVEFSKPVEGYADRVKKCTIAALYGIGTNDRVFISGNPNYRNTDWRSNVNDPSYFPDLNYARVGAEGTRIMGYLPLGSSLAIIKEDNQQDSTIFLRSAELSTGGEVLFPMRQGIAGVGAIAAGSVRMLRDEPLFLSHTGIYGIATNAITYERTVQNRSYFVDAKLTKEPNMEKAVAIEWNGYFICCINSKCYILDGKQNKSYKPQSYGDYVYECYHWENIPAVAFMEHDGDLYFGTEDGRICRFNNDIATMDKYNDDGAAIVARWSTKSDDDGDFMRRKSMIKKGCGVMIKPFTRSSVKVLLRTEADLGKQVRYETMDIWDWTDIDFSRIGFNSNDAPQVVSFNTKLRKYIALQIIVMNDAVNEGFGVFGIIKRYTIGNYVKG
ncbi:hypothetical protein [Marasmitruncus massiliensis]|uniref:hypothetical protein n=1 Tax=Marasmitruncus massiliensis TaxID=1944642 RepID=UPI000C7CEB46|nr:hypothetical protein [Marasmitruncus massiliensis]